jgi:predicted CoA-binding protein
MKTVAVIGASNDRRKFGNKAVRGYQLQGYTVIPINSHEAEVEGIPAYTSVLEVPQPIDMATIYLPPGDGLGVLAEIAEKGIPEVWVNPGADSPALVRRARELGIEPIIACSLMAIGEMPGDG